MQMGWPDLPLAEQLQPLLEDVLELLLGATLEQHVPVGSRGLLGLLLGTDAGRAQRLGTAPRALPHGRDLRLDRHGHLELVTVHAAVSALLTSRELDPALSLETLS